jgi:hypothetical protein
MTTVRQVDSLVVADDAVAARLWPRLGARVRQAYLADRDGWVRLRRRVEVGESISASTLLAQHKVFSGWARAFHAAAPARPKRSRTPLAAAQAVGPAAATTATAASVAPRSTALAAPVLATASKAPGGAGTAVAGGLVLAGLIAVAARRRSQ